MEAVMKIGKYQVKQISNTVIHTLTTMKSDKVLVILMPAMTWAMADMSDNLYQVHSSCSGGSSPWTRAKPHQLRSWLGSIVPGKVMSSTKLKDFSTHLLWMCWLTNLVSREGTDRAPTGQFSHGEGSLSPKSITSSSGITWKKFGNDPLDGWLYDDQMDDREPITAYIYSDLRTACVGLFEEKVMVEARASRVSQSRYIN